MNLSRVVLATHNPKKLTELRRVVAAADLDVEISGLEDFDAYPPPVETERTFEGNALLKAHAAARHTGLPALADDSGIEVDELNSMPGVRSARWAGPQCDDEANLQLLLAQLEGVPERRRQARFVCALALVAPEMAPVVWRGELPGSVAVERSGSHGFGYDPIFIPAGHTRTTAELDPAEKDAISHRGQALGQFAGWLKEARDAAISGSADTDS